MQKRPRMGHSSHSPEPMHGIHHSLCPSSSITKNHHCNPTSGLPPPIRRIDLVVTNSDFSILLADITITHPNPSSNQSVTQAMLRQGYFAQHRKRTKRTKYADVATSIGAKFIPLVLETYGSTGANSLQDLSTRTWNKKQI